ncbi:MAG: hypothetical protein KatS3mg109_0958 [Pirellulaceae bacterium]|nr:MAG: hypothetical protein KatS3mg109_0958 [Pirellulaceae bacterium]
MTAYTAQPFQLFGGQRVNTFARDSLKELINQFHPFAALCCPQPHRGCARFTIDDRVR